MEILDIGTGELLLIAALALIFIGPKRLSESWSDMGKWLNKLVRSDTWKTLRDVSNQITHAPNRMMRDANMEELEGLERELDLIGEPFSPQNKQPALRSSSSRRDAAKDDAAEHSILPPNPKRSVSLTSAHPPTQPHENKNAVKIVSKKRTATSSAKTKSNTSKVKPAKKKRADA